MPLVSLVVCTTITYNNVNTIEDEKKQTFIFNVSLSFFHHLPSLEPLNGRKSKEMEKYGNKNSLKQTSTDVENLRDHLSNLGLKRPLKLSERCAIDDRLTYMLLL